MTRRPPVPSTGDRNVDAYLRDQSQYVEMELRGRTPDSSARQSLLLLSPDRSIWEVAITDAGVLTTTKVQQG